MNKGTKSTGWYSSVRMFALALALALTLGTTAVSVRAEMSQQAIDKLLDVHTDTRLITSPLIDTINKVRNSVVGITNYGSDNMLLPARGQNAAEGTQEKGVPNGTGSGTVITPWGHVLTNYHVVEGALRLTVVDGTRELPARLVAGNPDLDLALIQAEGLNLPPVSLGNSDALQVGEWAIIVGNPLGHDLERSVSVGVISALNRELQSSQAPDRFDRVNPVSNLMIQTDAVINTGASGGAMFNILGQMQGIPTMKYSDIPAETPAPAGGTAQGGGESISVEGIGLCIPINEAKRFIHKALGDDLAVQGKKEPGMKAALTILGIEAATVNPGFMLRKEHYLPKGAYVSKVSEGSPAQKGGILTGDIIVSVNGGVIADAEALIAVLGHYQAGNTLALKIFRMEKLAEALQSGETHNMQDPGKYMDLKLTLY